jgi:predicted aspartyl protease
MATAFLNSDGVPIAAIEVASRSFEAVIDTAFEGGLQLPNWFQASLNLTPYREILYELGLGRTATTYSYLVEIVIGGETLVVETVFAPSDQVLLGVDALNAYRLEINFPAGTVVLEKVA